MNTKQLTQHTLHSIEEALASQGIALTTQGKHRLEDILQDHNTAYKQMIVEILKKALIECMTVHSDLQAYRVSILSVMLDEVQSL